MERNDGSTRHNLLLQRIGAAGGTTLELLCESTGVALRHPRLRRTRGPRGEWTAYHVLAEIRRDSHHDVQGLRHEGLRSLRSHTTCQYASDSQAAGSQSTWVPGRGVDADRVLRSFRGRPCQGECRRRSGRLHSRNSSVHSGRGCAVRHGVGHRVRRFCTRGKEPLDMERIECSWMGDHGMASTRQGAWRRSSYRSSSRTCGGARVASAAG